MDDWRTVGDWAAAAKAAGVPEDIMPLSDRRLRDRAKAWPSRPSGKSGGGLEYPLSALPEDARLLISRHELANAVKAGSAEGMRAALGATMDARAKLAARTAGLAAFMQLSPAQQMEADAKAAVIDACRTYIRRLGLPTKRGREIFATEYTAGRIPVEDWVRGEIAKCCRGSIENWERELDQHGVTGLASKHGQHRKGTGMIDSNPAIKQFLLGMLVDHPHAEAGLVMKGLRARFGADDIPGYRTVQRWLKGWKEDNEQVFTAITNPDKWKNRFMSAVGDADAHIVRINQRWELDSTKADLMLADGKVDVRAILALRRLEVDDPRWPAFCRAIDNAIIPDGSIRAAGFETPVVQERLHRRSYNGEIVYDGRYFHGWERAWALYRVLLNRPIRNDQAATVRAILAETAPARSHLLSLDFQEVSNLYDGRVRYDGAYNHGVA